jgi:anti-sigma regulatory factor (Ser/Thr protein kinase)
VRGVPAELAGLTAWLQGFWDAHALPPESAFTFELALEELFVNIATHGAAPGREPAVEVSLALDDGEVALCLEDDGPAFDPLAAPMPDLDAALEDRPIGGLGIHLLREMMDELEYARLEGRNRLTLRKRIAA